MRDCQRLCRRPGAMSMCMLRTPVAGRRCGPAPRRCASACSTRATLASASRASARSSGAWRRTTTCPPGPRRCTCSARRSSPSACRATSRRARARPPMPAGGARCRRGPHPAARCWRFALQEPARPPASGAGLHGAEGRQAARQQTALWTRRFCTTLAAAVPTPAGGAEGSPADALGARARSTRRCRRPWARRCAL